jgi:8-hydroxy-5-deazaflavin:NADPH oxidoreductase
MDIGIVGSGNIGSTVAKLAVDAGHTVKISNSRGPETLTDLVAELGAATEAVDVSATGSSDIVVVAIPLHAVTDLPPGAFTDTVVADANNYYPGRDGEIPSLESGEKTSTELLADHLTATTVVKAFNTMNYKILAAEGDTSKPTDERLALYIAGDDEIAKKLVTEFVESLGFGAVDAGGLAEGGRKLQPGAPVYGADLTVAEAREQLA